MPTFPKVGLDALLTPENCAVLLIDHQPSQLANVNSHDPTLVINNVTALAKTAKAFGVPTILTTINSKRGGEIFKQIQSVFPDQKPIDRSFINSWEDRRVVEAVKNTGRKKLVIAALWSEMCLAQPAIHAMGDGYDVYAVTDASGGVTPEAHDMAIRRIVAAGAQPITWLAMAGELQRDWARTERLGYENNSHHRGDRPSGRRGRAGAAGQGVSSARPDAQAGQRAGGGAGAQRRRRRCRQRRSR